MIKLDESILNLDYSGNCFICKYLIDRNKHIGKTFPKGISNDIFYGIKKYHKVLKKQKMGRQ